MPSVSKSPPGWREHGAPLMVHVSHRPAGRFMGILMVRTSALFCHHLAIHVLLLLLCVTIHLMHLECSVISLSVVECVVLCCLFFFKKTNKKTPHCTWEKQAFVPKPVIQRLKKIPNWKLSSINQYSTDCSVGMLFLLCGMWVPAAAASLYLVSGDLYILNWRKPVSSQAPSGVCSSLQTATSSGRKDECVCPAWHHAFIIHKRTLQAGVLQPPPPSCVVLVSSRGSYTSTSSRMKINILLRSAGCRRTVPPQRENLEAVTKH